MLEVNGHRSSARTPNAFVLMLKLTAVTGIQKRIVFKHGMFRMDGSIEAYVERRAEPAGFDI